MSVISGTRIPAVNSTTSALQNPCSTGLYWNATGSIVAGTGTAGNALNQLNTPFGIYLDSNDSLFIGDSGNNRVMKYLYGASNGTVIAGTTSSSGAGFHQLSSGPYGIYVDSSQNVYIGDTVNFRVMRWANGASNGTLVAGSGSLGSALNQFNNGEGVWVDSSLNLFVADRYNHRVTKWALGASSGVVVAGMTGSPGNTPDTLNSPIGLFFDENNQDLYIANTGGMTVVKRHIGQSNGTLIAGVFGVGGSAATQFNNLYGITLDQWKNLYVADYSNNRIQLFCYGSTTSITIAGSGSNGNSLLNPAGVKLDSQMNLYVSEFRRDRVTKYKKF